MSDTRYEQLHYPGDVTGSDDAQPGRIPGGDEFGRPYEVLDAEYEPCPECDPTVGYPGPVWQRGEDPDRASCLGCRGKGGRTTVNVQYATAESIVAGYQRLQDHVAHLAPPPLFRRGGVSS